MLAAVMVDMHGELTALADPVCEALQEPSAPQRSARRSQAGSRSA